MMQQRTTLWPWPRRRQPNGIDLGGGRLVPAEDLLEGHFRRMAHPVAAHTSHDVNVQVSRDASAAIRVVAPTLAPLTQVAEELASRLTTVKPTPQFRADLQRALEAEMQRRLEAGAPADASPSGWLWAAALITSAGLATLALWLLRRRK